MSRISFHRYSAAVGSLKMELAALIQRKAIGLHNLNIVYRGMPGLQLWLATAGLVFCLVTKVAIYNAGCRGTVGLFQLLGLPFALCR